MAAMLLAINFKYLPHEVPPGILFQVDLQQLQSIYDDYSVSSFATLLSASSLIAVSSKNLISKEL